MHYLQWIRGVRVEGDEVVITGSTSGIGHEYAKAFARAGCDLVCISEQREALDSQKIRFEKEYSIKVTNFCVDLRDIQATKNLGSDLMGRQVRVLINNAGFGLKGYFETNSIENYIDVIAVNVTAPVILSHALLPKLQERGACMMVHVASINALVPIPYNQVYTATKAFCASFASAVARENKKRDLLFQLVLPGTTQTPFHDRQGVKPKNLVMTAEAVVSASLSDIHREVCIPNPADRPLRYLIPFLPRNFAMDLASYMLKKRLGIGG